MGDEFVVLLYGRAQIRSVTLQRSSPPPPISKDVTAGPWRDNLAGTYPDQPATARFSDDLDLGPAGTSWALTVEIRSDLPAAEMNALVLAVAGHKVVGKLRARLSAPGTKYRTVEFSL